MSPLCFAFNRCWIPSNWRNTSGLLTFLLPQLFFQFFSTLVSISVPSLFYLVPLYLLQEVLCSFFYEENCLGSFSRLTCGAPWQPAPWILLTWLMNCCVTPPVVMSRQASDASVTLLNIPEMAPRCKGKNGSGKSQWHFPAAFSADTGSSGGSLLSMLCTQLQYHWHGTGSAEANFPWEICLFWSNPQLNEISLGTLIRCLLPYRVLGCWEQRILE